MSPAKIPIRKWVPLCASETSPEFTSSPRMSQAPFSYSGPEALRSRILHALMGVVDPEPAMSIVDVGGVYGVAVDVERVHVSLTMTSAACPVADSIFQEIESELDCVVPPDLSIEVELVREPPWTSDRMSPSAKRFMGW